MHDNESNSIYATFADIEALIGVASESNDLEFKRGDELDTFDQSKTKEELIRDVSAFANAGGGTIIYGIEEDKGARPIASGIWPVKNEKITDLRLTQVIRTGLEPVLSKFVVQNIDAPGGGRIFVITVEKADTAHQCKADQKYYHRVGQHRPAMYDYEIRDVMNRRTAPVVRVYYSISAIERSSDRHVYVLTPALINEGQLTAQHWALDVIIPEVGGVDTQAGPIILEKARLRSLANHRVFEFTCDRTPMKGRAVLLPGQSLPLGQGAGYAMIRLTVTDDTHKKLAYDQPPIVLRLYVDDCRMEETVIPFDKWCTF